MTIPTQGYATLSATSPLLPFTFERRDPRATDVVIDIQYCGVCHSDIHSARNEWGGAQYPYMALLKRDATMVVVGAVEPLSKVSGVPFIFRRRSMAGSLIGGLPETQEMLDFCGTHKITCDIEMIDMKNINAAYERTIQADVKYRFVIDMATLNS